MEVRIHWLKLRTNLFLWLHIGKWGRYWYSTIKVLRRTVVGIPDERWLFVEQNLEGSLLNPEEVAYALLDNMFKYGEDLTQTRELLQNALNTARLSYSHAKYNMRVMEEEEDYEFYYSDERERRIEIRRERKDCRLIIRGTPAEETAWTIVGLIKEIINERKSITEAAEWLKNNLAIDWRKTSVAVENTPEGEKLSLTMEGDGVYIAKFMKPEFVRYPVNIREICLSTLKESPILALTSGKEARHDT